MDVATESQKSEWGMRNYWGGKILNFETGKIWKETNMKFAYAECGLGQDPQKVLYRIVISY